MIKDSKTAWYYAEEAHVGQKYGGDFPYIKHISDCVDIYQYLLAKFINKGGVISETEQETLLCIIILHDALEDGRGSYNDLKNISVL